MAKKKNGPSRLENFRLADSERIEFIATAKRLGQTRANLLRRAVRDIIDRPANLLDKELGALADAVYQLKAVGRNLNQLTVAVHIGKATVVEPAALESVRAAVSALDARVTALINASRLRRVLR